MKIKEVIEELKTLNQESEFLVSSDEELNTLFNKFEFGILEDNKVCIYGLSGFEED